MIVMETGGVRPATARMLDYKPILTDYNATLTLQSVFAKDHSKTDQTTAVADERRGLRETLDLATTGFVYDPALMVFEASGSHGQDQTRIYYDNQDQSQGGGLDNYNLRGMFLQNKPYNLELYTKRDKPFSTSSTNNMGQQQTTQSGANLSYRKQFYSAKFRYQKTNRSDSDTSSDNDIYNLFGSFNKAELGWLKDFSTNAMLRYQTDNDANDSNDPNRKMQGNGDNQQTSISNHFNYKIFDFSTDLNQSNFNHEDGVFTGAIAGPGQTPKTTYSNDLQSVNENIGAQLPWHLTSRLNLWDTQSNDNSTRPQPSGLGAAGSSINSYNSKSKSSRDDQGYKFDLTHRLFDSLVTRFTTDSRTTNDKRTDTMTDLSGHPSDQEPTKGTNEEKNWGLESDYQKLLPANSLATATLSTQNSDNNQTGVSAQYLTYSKYDGPNAVRLNDNRIRLDTTTDLSSPIIVEVLSDNPASNTNCANAVQNPRTANACWSALNGSDYTFNPNDPREVWITGNVKPYLNSTYYNLLQVGSTYGPFQFRVTTYLTPAKINSHTISASAGINLFQRWSAKYQHTVTTQDGQFSGTPLAPKVTDDLASIGYHINKFRIETSRRWINGMGKLPTLNNTAPTAAAPPDQSGDAIIDTTRASYDWSKMFLKFVSLSLSADAHSSYETGHGYDKFTDASNNITFSQTSFVSTEDGYSSTASLTSPVPFLKAVLKAQTLYNYTRGNIFRMGFAYGALVPTQDLGTNKLVDLQNSLTLSRGFQIPWVECTLNSYISYIWETTHGDQNMKSNRLQYGLNAGRAWVLGATSINLNANYSFSDYHSDEELLLQSAQARWLRNEQSDSTSVVLTIVRQLL